MATAKKTAKKKATKKSEKKVVKSRIKILYPNSNFVDYFSSASGSDIEKSWAKAIKNDDLINLEVAVKADDTPAYYRHDVNHFTQVILPAKYLKAIFDIND